MKNSNEVHLADCKTDAKCKVDTESAAAKRREFDEWKLRGLANIEKIIVDSKVADVHISSAKVSAIEIHLQGKAQIDGDIRLSVKHEGIELKVAIEVEGMCYLSNLRLDITIPRTHFKTLSIQTSAGDVCVDNEDVLTYKLEVKTISGKIDIKKGVCIRRISLDSSSGDVLVNHIHGNERMVITTSSGKVIIGSYVWSGSVNIKTESGRVEMSGFAAEEATVQTSSSNINLCDGFFAKKLYLKSRTGNVTLSEGDASNKLVIETDSGNVNAIMVSNDTLVKTNSGHVDLHLDAEKDIMFYVSTFSGNVKMRFEHVKSLKVLARSSTGKVGNHFSKSLFGHTAKGSIMSQSGKIVVK